MQLLLLAVDWLADFVGRLGTCYHEYVGLTARSHDDDHVTGRRIGPAAWEPNVDADER